ncbi:zinc finger and SCAN domain-containing protein 18 [Carlito syrichta]|uniref:Zinc finger and SCAN domain-containing protein 18 n=1 Tax=Carlito syrichta TaxID=1868482 RepID=A0A3Q0E5E6_CARSF|nr:zinc finger and SCAN domain-containing protein 18 [Carlito syrichta]
MLPLEKASASPRSSPTPPELPTSGSAAGVQQEEPETIPERTPADLEFSRLRFREFVYQEAAGPHQTLARLHELCRQWLMPEARSKEQMLELLVLEQFLGILPDRVRPWVVAQYPESCKKAASLVEGLADVLEEPGMLLGSPGSSSALSEGVFERHLEPLLLPGPASPGSAPGPGEIPAPFETPWLAPGPLLPEQGSVKEAKTEEASPATAEPKKSFPEEPQPLGEWGHLDPAEENLKSYRKLLLSGYQLSQPDAASRLDTEELRLVEREPPGGGLPGGQRQESAGGTLERCAGDTPGEPSPGAVEDQEGQPGKAPEPQDAQDGEASPATGPLRQSVICQPAQDKGARLASPAQGQGTKRPHPDDTDGPGPEHDPSVGLPARQEPPGQDPGPSAPRGALYTCVECGAAFAWLSHLMEHQRDHSGQQRHACPGCWKTFHFSLALAEHQKTHEKERGYAQGSASGPQPTLHQAPAGHLEHMEGEAFPAPSEAQR